MADLNRIKTVLAERGIMAHPHTLPAGFVGCAEKRVESHICICFMAYKVYKEPERIIRIAGIDLSVDAVLKIAKTIATIRITCQTTILPYSKHSYSHQPIIELKPYLTSRVS